MGLTVFSFAMAILWCNIYIIIITLLRKRNIFFTRLSYFPFLFLAVVGLLRIVCSVEFPNSVVIESETIFPVLYSAFTAPIIKSVDGNSTLLVSDVFVILWITGSLFYLTLYLVQLRKLHLMLASIPKTKDKQIINIMTDITEESGKSTSVKIINSETFAVPMITGFFRPTVCLPEINFSEDDLKLILKHEWTHFLHKDAWVKLFVYIVAAAFWWNPFVHILKRDLNHILEVKCDLSVTSKMDLESRIEYLNCIKRVATHQYSSKCVLNSSLLAVGLIGAKSESKIEQRFHVVLDYEPGKLTRLILNSIICVLIVLSLVVSYLFIVQPAYSTDDLPDGDSLITLTPENSYLTVNDDGSYNVYYNDRYMFTTASINDEPLKSLPIKTNINKEGGKG